MDELIKKMIRGHEGLRLKPYRDTKGVLTIGYGLNLEDGITLEEAEYLMASRIKRAAADLASVFPNCAKWHPRIHAAMLSMMYNLGKTRFLKFERMIAAIRAGDWGLAVAEMKDSLWFQQVPNRVEEIARMILEAA